ncbi:3,4-dihydroxy-2-butanone-4-phosphate synthase [Candidatus Haliotispira prima]|uniref:3,4-dihydroxy-2-butanone 4-phosphate synthase n=1 Tax=Candidatus Haliotispira prima TaxID=3034016 RepID=A0ABY8MKC6_9SPIO|nr:3,4-dihydroxy-2-butanone-4-phosphate synthase [Candidatus Haliotispira prima]
MSDACKKRIERALEDLRAGRFVIVCDDDSRENEGDLIAAAELITPDLVNFVITEARGLLCQAVDESTARYLGLPMMSKTNNSQHETAFTVSVDHIEAGTGISAKARALTIQSIATAAKDAQSNDITDARLAEQERAQQTLLRPGHIFPLQAMPGGVLQRNGHTEATVDLMRLAGLKPSGILCEIIGRDGEMARGRELDRFAEKHQMCKITVEDLVIYRREVLGHTWGEQHSREARLQNIRLERDTEVQLPSNLGAFQACAIEDVRDIGAEHLLIWSGELQSVSRQEPAPLLRVHSECFTGEVLFSRRCDCRDQLDYSLKAIEAEGSGLLIYLRQEGRGIGLRNKLRAYQIQQQKNLDTVEANATLGFDDDLREYSVAIGVLRQLGVTRVRLLTNNPNKIRALEDAGILVERVPVKVEGNPHNQRYLATKKQKSGHLL